MFVCRPPLKKAKSSSDYVVSLIHPDGEDFIEEADKFLIEVFCISQNMRNLSDPAVRERNCLVANPDSESPLKIKGVILSDFMVIHSNHMMLICFEAHKNLDQGFTEILHAYGGQKQHQKFIKKFK